MSENFEHSAEILKTITTLSVGILYIKIKESFECDEKFNSITNIEFIALMLEAANSMYFTILQFTSDMSENYPGDKIDVKTIVDNALHAAIERRNTISNKRKMH